MKNHLTDLTDHLFAQLERLGDETLTAEQLTTEIQRTGAMTTVAREIISAGRLAVDATKAVADNPEGRGPRILGLDGAGRPALPRRN